MDEQERFEMNRKAERVLRKKIRERQRLEQEMAEVLDLLPGFTRQLYLRMMEEGFNDEQAMALTMSYVESTSVPLV